MGLFAGGEGPFRLNADALAQIMRPAVEAWFDGHVQVLDPKTTTTTPYDARTDTGGESIPMVVWDSGPQGALVQPLRAQTIGDFGGQQVGLLAVRIQAAIPDSVELRSGLHIKVLDGGSDAEVTRHLYALGTGIDSSMRWVTRLTATVVAT